MSAKFIHSLSDENPDLQKQIGCMNGIFQLFERHHFLSGRRRQITGQNHNRIPSGQNGSHSLESNRPSQKTTEKNQKKTVNEKRRISTESSRISSFSSSSCSSSLSSSECNIRASQLEPCSFNQSAVSETYAQGSPVHQLNASFRSSHPSPDLRALVKDSIYREARSISVKTATKGESGGQTLKYFDSPRPAQYTKSFNSKVSGQESFQVLHKLQEAPQKSSEMRRSSLTTALKDTRRFSCDGRESRVASKSTVKLKELPRLSLDSRVRGSTTEMKSNYLLGDLQRSDGNSSNFLNQQEEPESRTRLSNVVAKLMGLEAFPDSMPVNENQTTQNKTHPDVQNNQFLGSSKTTEENKQNRIPGSPRNLHKEPISPRLRNPDSVKKPIPNSKFPLEPAPWRQPDKNRNSQTPASTSRVTSPKAPNTSLSVFGEIEKRLAQLEFKRSGKDLRALKQILEAMQKTKEMMDSKSEAPKSGNQTSSNSILHNHHHQSNSSISTLTRETSSPNSFKSPIVIMKPAKLMHKSSNPASSDNPAKSSTVLHRLRTADFTDYRKELIEKQTAKDLTPRANRLRQQSSPPSCLIDKNTAARFARQSHTSKELQSTTKESTNSGRSSGTLNLRQPQKKLGLEKQTRSAIQSSDSMRTRRQSRREPTELGSPCRKPRTRPSNLQPSDDELSDVGSDLRDLNHHGDAISLQSESSISLALQADEEVSSTDRSYKITQQIQRKPVARPTKDRSVTEPVVASEQPSPVSVLDTAFYGDDLPSPIKKKSIAFKEEVQWNQMDVNHLPIRTMSGFNSAINHKKLENIHLLLQKLSQKLSAHEEHLIGEKANLYSHTNPDHQYISEILLASGMLKDSESSFTTGQTAYPINPTLFLILEQAKASTTYSDESPAMTSKSEFHIKNHRKVVFDVVNEILIHKLLLENPSKHWLSPNILANKRQREERLLGQLCSEVDRLQGNASNYLDDVDDSLKNVLQADLMHHSEHWTAYRSEIPALVLDVERLIFKDLISEIITDETLGLRVQSAGRYKQLFYN